MESSRASTSMLSIGFVAASAVVCPSRRAEPVQPPLPENGSATTGDTPSTPFVARSAATTCRTIRVCFVTSSYSSKRIASSPIITCDASKRRSAPRNFMKLRPISAAVNNISAASASCADMSVSRVRRIPLLWLCRVPDRNTSCTSARAVMNAGPSPKTRVAILVIAIAAARIAALACTRSSSGTVAGANRRNALTHAIATPTPRAPPASASSAFSVMSCVTTCAREPPSARRTATSRTRSSPRTRSRSATSRHAITSRSAAAAAKISTALPVSPRTTSTNGRDCARKFRVTVDRSKYAFSSARAAAGVEPRARRPTRSTAV